MISFGRYRIGRRAAFLTLFGIAYLMIGNALLTTNETPLVRHVFRFALSIMPLHGWGTAWIICGAVALIDGLWPRGRDTVGFVAAVVAPVAWAIVYFIAWAQLDVPGVRQLWENAVVYLMIACAVAIVAGMPEPRTVRRALISLGRSSK